MKIIKVNNWYINLDQVTYIHKLSSYVKIGLMHDYIELADEDATAFIEALEGAPDRSDVTSLRRNAGE